jgi:hypothetical protein
LACPLRSDSSFERGRPKTYSYDTIHTALFMDLRDELKQLNKNLMQQRELPQSIRRNTAWPMKKARPSERLLFIGFHGRYCGFGAEFGDDSVGPDTSCHVEKSNGLVFFAKDLNYRDDVAALGACINAAIYQQPKFRRGWVTIIPQLIVCLGGQFDHDLHVGNPP